MSLSSILSATLDLPGWDLPRNASAHGSALDRHLLLNLWIVVALLTAAHLILLMGLLLRRHSASASRSRSIVLIEYLPLTALAILFGFLTLRAERLWAASRYVGADPAALQVEATGMQFAWYFRYPGTDAVLGRTRPELIEPGAGNPLGLDSADPHSNDDFVSSELVLPVGREIDVRLHAQDVIHGFSVPAMRIKQNAVPGQNMHLHFTPVELGTYAILCTQLCGLGHFRMTANMRVVSPEEYAAWLRTREAGAGAQASLP